MTDNREITSKLLTTAFMASIALAAVAVLVVIGSLGALFRAAFGFARLVFAGRGDRRSDADSGTSFPGRTEAPREPRTYLQPVRLSVADELIRSRSAGLRESDPVTS